MADTTLLRNSAIVRNATTAPPQHGQVKTGALPVVQVKMTPGGPQVQEGQQKPVTILPPRDAQSAVATGGLPMVNIKMTTNGPQVDDGQDRPVVIKDNKPRVSAGGLPMLDVKMTSNGPQVQTLSTVQGGPPQIPGAPPVLSAPRATNGARPTGGYVNHPAGIARVASSFVRPGGNGAVIARVAAPMPQVALPPVPELATEQLMLCRHLADKYLAEQLAAVVPPEGEAAEAEAPIESEAVQLARSTITTIDDVLVSTAIRAEAAEKAALAYQAAAAAPAMPTVAAAASTSISPAPTASYVAGRVGARSYTGARGQRNAGMAPRRTARPGPPLPMVVVKMDGKQAAVQNPDEVAQARQMVAEAATAEVVAAPPATPPSDAQG